MAFLFPEKRIYFLPEQSDRLLRHPGDAAGAGVMMSFEQYSALNM
jgi:hypothetical protein